MNYGGACWADDDVLANIFNKYTVTVNCNVSFRILILFSGQSIWDVTTKGFASIVETAL